MIKPKEDWPFEVKNGLIYINERLYKPSLSVTSLKADCNITSNTFSGKFKYYVRKTPKRYTIFHRVKTGKLLLNRLNKRDITISLVAQSVGYLKHSSFSKAFKTIEGMAPSEFMNGR